MFSFINSMPLCLQPFRFRTPAKPAFCTMSEAEPSAPSAKRPSADPPEEPSAKRSRAISDAERAAALRIQALYRGHRTRAMVMRYSMSQQPRGFVRCSPCIDTFVKTAALNLGSPEAMEAAAGAEPASGVLAGLSGSQSPLAAGAARMHLSSQVAQRAAAVRMQALFRGYRTRVLVTRYKSCHGSIDTFVKTVALNSAC